MNLQYLPSAGPRDLPWSAGIDYVIQSKSCVGDAVVVLGRQIADGREGDWFVATYDQAGNRYPRTSGFTAPHEARAREVFDQVAMQRWKDNA